MLIIISVKKEEESMDGMLGNPHGSVYAYRNSSNKEQTHQIQHLSEKVSGTYLKREKEAIMHLVSQ